MFGIGFSISLCDITNTVSTALGNAVIPPPPPPDTDRYLDGGDAFTEAFSRVIDCGDASTTSIVIEYNGNSA